jgi:hypothetical protein
MEKWTSFSPTYPQRIFPTGSSKRKPALEPDNTVLDNTVLDNAVLKDHSATSCLASAKDHSS